MRQLENIDPFVILDPQPEWFNVSMDLAVPIERPLDLDSDLQNFSAERPELVR